MSNTTSVPMYVICSAGFEYNDEIYYRPECGGGHPIKVFSSKELADKVCHELNFKEFMNQWGDELRNYSYSIENIFHDEEAVSLFEKYLVKINKKDDDWPDWQTMPPEILDKLFRCCSVVWYEVYQVESHSAESEG